MNNSKGEDGRSGQAAAIPTELISPINWGTSKSYLRSESAAPSLVWPDKAISGVDRHNLRYANEVELFLTLERPEVHLLNGADRGERYRQQMAHAWAQRQRLAHWIEEQGLCDQIMRLSEPNCFHLLFVRCTPEAARRFAHAPGVIDLAISQPD